MSGVDPRRPLATPARRGLQRPRHEPDYLLMVAVVALAALGILMVYSSTAISSLVANDEPLSVVGPQAMWAVAGVIGMLVVMRVDYRWWRLASVPGYIVALVLLVLVLLPPIGPLRPIEAYGSARWLQVGPLPAMHPAEFAKLALVVYLAHWLSRPGRKPGSVMHGLVPFALICGPLVGLVMLEPDLGTSGVLAMTGLAIFFVAGGSVAQLALLAPAGVVGLYWVINHSQYQMDRIRAFLDPFAHAQDIGFHTVQGLLALGMGGLMGIGLGESRQPGQLHLPAAQNDFVFAVAAQELGFVGAIAIIALYLILAVRGLRIAMAAPDTFGALMAAGITAWLGLQAFINIAVVIVLLPITGITLPFISAGGSSLLVSFVAVGILLSVSRETQPRGILTDAHPDRGRGHGRPRLSRAGRPALPARAQG